MACGSVARPVTKNQPEPACSGGRRMHDARKAWHIGDIVTITTGFLVSPRKLGYLALQEYMANRTLDAGERLLYSPVFRSALLVQYPELREFCLDHPLPDELCGEWLRRRV